MHRIERWLERCSWRLNAIEPYRSEALFTLCSLWAARQFFTSPSNFEAYQAGFAFSANLATEREWGWFALVGALTKIAGLALTWFRRSREAALILRLLGLAMSGMLWVLLGVSVVVGRPDTLFGFPVMLFGFTAWWLLLRMPVMP